MSLELLEIAFDRKVVVKASRHPTVKLQWWTNGSVKMACTVSSSLQTSKMLWVHQVIYVQPRP